MSTEYHYKQFPPQIELDQEMQKLMREARTELGRYDGFLSSMQNNLVLLSPLFMQEAVLSSRIEGTQSTLTEVLEFEGQEGERKGLSQEKQNDIKEVLNYRFALNKAIELMNKNIPLSGRVLKEAHKELMQGARGKNYSPGAYRKSPVWMDPDKSNMDTARFIPIDASKIQDAISAFEKYLHDSNDFDDLIKVAVLHAEFEAIHPFLDGNGRLGRLFIPLYLFEKELISSPSFYISSYFEKNRDTYYDLLLAVSKTGDWLLWCKFFIQGVLEQSKDNLKRAKKIVDYYNELKIQIPKITNSQHGITALDFIFRDTYFKSTAFYQKANIPKPTAIRLLNVFVDKNILECISGGGRRANFYVFKKLIDIADGK